MKPYGRIRNIESFEDAPEEAYIIREMGDLTVRLEYYWKPNGMTLLHEFPQGSFFEWNFEKTLIEARKIMKNKKILWVERPLNIFR